MPQRGTHPYKASSLPTSDKGTRPRNASSRQHSAKRRRKSSTISPDGLGIYLDDPSKCSNVVQFDDDFVIIKDLYPKATVHLLILPRDLTKCVEHPLRAFQDDEFLNRCRNEASKWRLYAAQLLKDAICPNNDGQDDYDWESNILIGIHARPSMEHLHIHVVSRDLHSDCMQEKTNYTSFTTPFFVPLEDFPLDEDEIAGRLSAIRQPVMTCQRCDETFTSFANLKKHLSFEFERWKDEVAVSAQSLSNLKSGTDCSMMEAVRVDGRNANVNSRIECLAKTTKRGPGIKYPIRDGRYGCPLPNCEDYVQCRFTSSNTAKKHYYRHDRFAIIYRWVSGESDDFNSCFVRLLAREFESRCIVPWYDKKTMKPNGGRPPIDEVKKALTEANAIVICLSQSDLRRCGQFSDDFFAFELQTALDLAAQGKPAIVLVHKTQEDVSLLSNRTLAGMDRLHDGLGSRLKKHLEMFRRYDIYFGNRDDNFNSIMDGICAKSGK